MVKAHIISKYKLPKEGNTIEEYEDAHNTTRTKTYLKVFIADGATESSFAKEWAEKLTKELASIKNFSRKNIKDHLQNIREKWREIVSDKPLPWYAEIKLDQGAFSAILGLRIHEKKAHFDCFSIGDCCLFQVREEKLCISFPINNVANFSNNPFLISTNQQDDISLFQHFKELKEKEIKKGDYLFVMSDALACWFLTKASNNDRPWHILLGFAEESSNKAFEDWLRSQRDKKEIKNDDTTLFNH